MKERFRFQQLPTVELYTYCIKKGTNYCSLQLAVYTCRNSMLGGGGSLNGLRKKEAAMPSGHLTHKQRDSQALAGGLTRQELAPPLRQMPAFTLMLRALVRQKTCP